MAKLPPFQMTREEKDLPLHQWSEDRQREFEEYRQSTLDTMMGGLEEKKQRQAELEARVMRQIQDNK